MNTGLWRYDTQQYCSLNNSTDKMLSNTSFMQFSPTNSSDCWPSIKLEVSSDSDSSQQTIIYGNTNADIPSQKNKKNKEFNKYNKPSQVVQKRNARERRRVEAVNNAFQKLGKVVPIEKNKSKRMSKVKTLQMAIEYINRLQNLLQLTTQHTKNKDIVFADLISDFTQQSYHVKFEQEFSVRTFYSHMVGEDNIN